MRKIVLGVLLCLLLSGCGGSPAEERAETEAPPARVAGPEKDWREAYVKRGGEGGAEYGPAGL